MTTAGNSGIQHRPAGPTLADVYDLMQAMINRIDALIAKLDQMNRSLS